MARKMKIVENDHKHGFDLEYGKKTENHGK
jgi:hypothetical protein